MYVEFLGIPRERVGVSEVVVEADTFGDVLRTLAARFPTFGDLMDEGSLHSSIAANLNGDTFIKDPGTRLASSDHLLILSADVGG